jgi:hypothetical protein
MASTTNYNWSTPDDTALVKDGASAIRTLGSAIDTTTKALNPSTTLGDIEYRSSTANTNTRLAIGTSGQVLSVNGGVPAWTTLAGSAVTKITSASFTTQSSVTIDSAFSSTYKHYMAVFEFTGSTSLQLRMQFRYSGSTESGAQYYGSNLEYSRANSASGNGFVGTTYATMLNTLENTPAQLTVFFSGVGGTNDSSGETRAAFWGNGFNSGDSQSAVLLGGRVYVNRTYDGIIFTTDTGTITGSYKIYGLAN